MRGPILEFADLQALTGYERLADVERCLEAAGIKVFRGRAGVWTTLQLVNAAGGLSKPDGDAYPADLAA